tara:strand:- start:1200 stop:1703 length:504 start_codon:yes stop_codon:yes gene_type:complete
MKFFFTKKNSNSNGDLFNITDIHKKKINIKLLKAKTLFGVEQNYNTKIIKWVIDFNKIQFFELIEKSLLKEFKLYKINNVNTRVIKKRNYPPMVYTKIANNKLSNDIIHHEKGEITSYSDITKNNLYDIDLTLENIFVKKDREAYTLYYNLEINHIKKNNDALFINK